MQINLSCLRANGVNILVSYMCYFGISNGIVCFFSIFFFVVSSMAYSTNVCLTDIHL